MQIPLQRNGNPGNRLRRSLIQVTAVGALLALGVSGCTSVPRNTQPQVLRPYEAPQARIAIPEPRPEENADVIFRDFLAAAAHPVDNYAAMRKFMTPELAARWQASEQVSIVDSINLISGPFAGANVQRYFARGTTVGLLGADGAYMPANSDYDVEVELVRDSSGQWRIAQLPDGVVVERQEFLDNSAPRNVYFLDPSGNQLVTDRRWLYRGVSDGATDLVTKIKNGPSAPLVPGVTTVLDSDATISVNIAPVERAQAREITITGLGEATNQMRVLLAAQLVWTLAGADYRGPWYIYADGAPLLESHEGPWTQDSEEIRSFDPSRMPGDQVRLRTVDNNGVYEMVDGVATANNTGWRARGGTILTSAAVGVDVEGTELMAAVFRDGREEDASSTLMLGRANGAPSAVLTAQSFTRPTWSPDATAVWTVRDGTTVMRIVRTDQSNQIATEEVDTTDIAEALELGTKQISEFRVNHSGTRVALIADGHVYTATIERSQNQPWRLTQLQPLPLAAGVDPVSLAWSVNETITIGAYGEESPMWRVSPDGATVSVLPKLNLSPPITVVTATSSKLYALDANALMELISGEGENQFWRQVPGVAGRMAPVSVE